MLTGLNLKSVLNGTTMGIAGGSSLIILQDDVKGARNDEKVNRQSS